MPEIVPFTAAHLPEAGRIAFGFWGERSPGAPLCGRRFDTCLFRKHIEHSRQELR